MTGLAPRLAAGQAWRVPAHVDKMEIVIANETGALQPKPPFTRRRLHHARSRMPVDGPDALALAPLDQPLVAVHRARERQGLHPVDCHMKSVVVMQILDLGSVLALNSVHPHR